MKIFILNLKLVLLNKRLKFHIILYFFQNDLRFGHLLKSASGQKSPKSKQTGHQNKAGTEKSKTLFKSDFFIL